MFLSYMQRTYKGLGLRANKTTYMNPNIPFLTATPDALIVRNATEIYGVVEVKDLGFKDEAAIWNQIVDGPSTLGLTGYREGEESPIQYRLRPGHQWTTQIVAQCLTLGVDFGVLALKAGSDWVTAELKM